MTLNRTTLTALAWIGAAAAVLVTIFLPLPRAVLSEEEHAAGRMPETRQRVVTARSDFERAGEAYRSYVASNDVSSVLNTLNQAAAVLAANPDSKQQAAQAAASAADVRSYLSALTDYARDGETYFQALRHYDDELMAWTRSLGAESEVLRSATWPIVEYLKLYPPPTGLADQYSWLGAADVSALAGRIQEHVAQIGPGGASSDAAAALQADVSEVRDAGRSVEYIESLHPQYENHLQEYDAKLQAVISARGATEPDARRALATVLDVGVAVLLGLGIAGLLLPRRPPTGAAN